MYTESVLPPHDETTPLYVFAVSLSTQAVVTVEYTVSPQHTMAAIRFAFLFLLIAAIIGCALQDQQLTIQVSESGQDDLKCIAEPQSHYACKTLVYVLNQMEQGITGLPFEPSQVFINVMYNQTIIHKILILNLSPQFYTKSVSVIGFNNAFINFEQTRSSIQISKKPTQGPIHPNNKFNWSWIGLGFAWDGQQKLDYEFKIPQIVMMTLSSFEVYNCKFISVSLYFIESTQGPSIVISDNVFGNSAFCPILNLVLTNPATVVNNTFENCHAYKKSLLYIKKAQNNPIKILNNLFTNLNAKDSISAIRITGATAGIIVQDNQFIGNTMSSIAIDVTVSNGSSIGDTCTWCSMQMNMFRNNHMPTNKQNPHPILVSIKAHIVTNVCPMEHFFNQNSFVNNKNTSLLAIEIGSNTKFLYNILRITSLTVLNNIGRSGLVTIINNNPLYGNVLVKLELLRIENNTSLYKGDTSTSLKTTIVYVKNIQNSIISDLTFQKNLGTSLVFENENVYDETFNLCVLGDLTFRANSGIYGGAMSLYSVAINSTCQSIVSFEKNYGVYGGALYLEDSQSLCVCPGMCFTTFEFDDNRATTSGNSVYFGSLTDFNLECKNFNMKDVGSAASNIILHSPDSCCLSIFPGQNIRINISITDHFNQTSLCTAGVSISCDDQYYTCFDQHIKLSGPSSVVLIQQPNTTSTVIDTNLVLQSPNHNNFQNIQLHLMCEDSNAQIETALNISSCPQGFTYDSKLNVCKCAIECEKTVCSTVLGAVCVSHGYWYGKVNNEYIVARCQYSACKIGNVPCPLGMQSGNNYFLLNGTQCSNGRGGVLCKVCAKHYVFSFLSIQCIPEEYCNSSKTIVLLTSAFLFQILITILLVLIVRFKHHLGCGFLYGPMLFLAVVNNIPLDDFSKYSTLSTAVSITTSVALLNLEQFGRIPWCFFESIPKLYNYSLRVLGPLTVLLVLLGISALARWHPKCIFFEKICMRMRVTPQGCLQCWQASHCRIIVSPLKAMCILMMLSFWSLANISINILTPTVLETQHYSMYMVSIQPEIAFFSQQHLPLAIPALLVLLVVILPLVFILLSAPFLQHVINLFKIKPFLDEFQSCYKDKYRWYSGVYFVVWIAIVSIQGLPDSLLYTQTIFFILLCAQILIKPYKSKLLNITDTLLLVDLNFLIALLYNKINDPISSMCLLLLIHVLIIVPFVCAALSLVCLLLIKYGVYNHVKSCCSRRKREQELQQPQDVERVLELSHPEVQVQEVRVPDASTCSNAEREPLIAIVDNQ